MVEHFPGLGPIEHFLNVCPNPRLVSVVHFGRKMYVKRLIVTHMKRMRFSILHWILVQFLLFKFKFNHWIELNSETVNFAQLEVEWTRAALRTAFQSLWFGLALRRAGLPGHVAGHVRPDNHGGSEHLHLPLLLQTMLQAFPEEHLWTKTIIHITAFKLQTLWWKYGSMSFFFSIRFTN